MPREPNKECFWSCPTCAEGHQDPKPTTMDTAESASQEVDDLKLEVQQLKAEVERLKGEGDYYIVDTTKYHTFVNASVYDRIHIVGGFHEV